MLHAPPLMQMGRLRLREDGALPAGARSWWGRRWSLNQACLTSELNSHHCPLFNVQTLTTYAS